MDSTNELAEGALWPLVKRVQLLGPWPVLASGAVLVDAPGVQDDNSARDQVRRAAGRVRQSLKTPPQPKL